ncbi:RUN and FYVE domain-containing protein 2 [Lepeophtheirus salmonis]|uniref:RUN and FYVE domain-containing protein 2 n=1 Tax=Lepeophtheirus salmonis TaxID=72036 RepID=UPI001AE19480|nr:RUN and FYVE domain-containing protein 2-like isoform X2 [Lepeophtheirus salmonis]
MDQDVPLSAPPNTSHKKTFDWFRSWSSLSQDLLYPPQSATSSSTTNNNVSEEFPSSSISNLFTTWNPNEKIRKFKDRDPILIERSNLVNILKLVIKEVIDSSLRFGRQLDSDHIPLQHFFIVLEHVLRHGLRPKKGLLGPKKELWDILQLVEKHDIEAADITASVRDLPTVRTQIGRARAWLRLALMQKRLSDYFQILIDLNQNLIRDEDLSEFYDPQALLRSEEAIIVMGHLVSLNVVDCNLCVKEEDLDSQQGVIDFSLYLRSKKDYSPNEDDGVVVEDEGGLENYNGKKPEKISAVLDQKNYIEELNRHLNATVANLEAKVESLTATNALMKEDLAISKNSLFCAEEENQKLLSTMGMTLLDSSNDEGNKNEMQISHVDISFDSKTYKEMEKRVQSEILQKENLQKKMDLQVRISEEMEMAMKLLEKDVHEKQDTIISLRDQLDDIKRINLEMYSKLQDCQISLKNASDQLSNIHSDQITNKDDLKVLKDRFKYSEQEKKTLMERITNLNLIVDRSYADSKSLRADLKIEMNLKKHLQTEVEKYKREHTTSSKELTQLKERLKDYDKVCEENRKLKIEVSENETTMEDLGAQLSHFKLQMDTLKEEKDLIYGQTWQKDNEVKECGSCTIEFNSFRRKHHCRNCGKIFCDKCSDNKINLTSSVKPSRVCDICHVVLFEAFTKKL